MGEHQQQQGQRKMMNAGLDLPSGFRFHPTDEEIITDYLTPKVHRPGFTSNIIGVVDLNRTEPWELPDKAMLGENEWYFYNLKDRKYPTGIRTNRATDAGYWKATGKDKEIYRAETLVGMKKTLVFYKGRAPKGGKTDWVMHEFRLHGGAKLQGPASSSSGSSSTATMKSASSSAASSMEQWVVCRVFHKSSGAKKEPLECYEATAASGDGSSSADVNNFVAMPMPVPMPMPMQFPMPPADFDAFFSAGGGNNNPSMPPPPLPPIAAMGSAGFQTNLGLFGNAMVPPVPQPMPAFYPQMGMGGGAGAGGSFMRTPESRPSSMVSQQGMSPDQQATTNAVEISSMVPSTPTGAMDMDGIWRY